MTAIIMALIWLSTHRLPVMNLPKLPEPRILQESSKKTIKQQKTVKKGAKTKNIELEDWKAEIARKICEKDWDCKTAKSIAYAESGLNPQAVSPTNDHGVFQLHGKEIYDVDANIEEAYRMYKSRGWKPWSAYNNGSYKKYNLTSSGALIE